MRRRRRSRRCRFCCRCCYNPPQFLHVEGYLHEGYSPLSSPTLMLPRSHLSPVALSLLPALLSYPVSSASSSSLQQWRWVLRLAGGGAAAVDVAAAAAAHFVGAAHARCSRCAGLRTRCCSLSRLSLPGGRQRQPRQAGVGWTMVGGANVRIAVVCCFLE